MTGTIHLTLNPPAITFGFDPLFVSGAAQLGWHGLFVALAVLTAAWYGVRRARQMGLEAAEVIDLAMWAVLGGIVGARLFHVFDHASYFAHHPLEVFAIWEGGIAVYGSFIGGICGGYIAARRYHLPPWTLLDAAAPAMLVGQIIGRLGCLSNGDAWGEPTGGAWGIVYTNPGDLVPASLLGVPTHPYPLYEIAAAGLLLGAMWLLRKTFHAPGSLFLFAAAGYASIRFGLTFFRQETVLFWGLQEAQVVAVVTAIAVAGIVGFRRYQSDRQPVGGPENARNGSGT